VVVDVGVVVVAVVAAVVVSAVDTSYAVVVGKQQ
jgi:hypothetical protein